MEKQYNPLKSWRGSDTPHAAAYQLSMPVEAYLILESHPEKSFIRSDQIIRIALITNIPLPGLVDWLAGNPKEVV